MIGEEEVARAIRITGVQANYRETARAAMTAHLAALEKAGWVVVPKEPNYEMVERGTVATLRLQLGKGGNYDAWDATRACWKKMLSAAPPAQNGDEVKG